MSHFTLTISLLQIVDDEWCNVHKRIHIDIIQFLITILLYYCCNDNLATQHVCYIFKHAIHGYWTFIVPNAWLYIITVMRRNYFHFQIVWLTFCHNFHVILVYDVSGISLTHCTNCFIRIIEFLVHLIPKLWVLFSLKKGRVSIAECLYLHNLVGYGPNSDSAAAAAAVAKLRCESSCGETDADRQTDKTDNVLSESEQ